MKFILLIFLFFIAACTNSQSMSIQSSKSFLNKNSVEKLSGKSRGYFNVEFVDVSTNEDILSLEAHVTANQNFNDAKIEWELPSHVLMDNAEVNSNFTERTPQVFSVEIKKDELKENDSILFFIYKIMDGERHGGSFSYIYHEKNSQTSKKSDNKSLKIKKKQKIIQ